MTSHKTQQRFGVLTASAIFFALAVALPNPISAHTFKVIHTFTGGRGGAVPYAGVVVDHAGNLYGTTAAGGDGSGKDRLVAGGHCAPAADRGWMTGYSYLTR
jgi:hypothetical protein